MAAKAPMKRTPAKKPVDMEKLDDFAAAANGEPQKKPEKKAVSEKESKPKKPPVLPWEKEGVSDQIPKPFNLRTNQVQVEKLKFVVKNIPGFNSVHAFCMNAVLKEMDKQLKKLLG